MPGDEPPQRVLATFNSYAGMLDALRARVTELGINGERFDEFAGLPTGYLSKLIGVAPVRRLGLSSFQAVMAGLGLRCQFVEDPEGTERLKSRVKPRNNSYPRTVYTLHTLTDRKWSRIQKLGRKARWKKLSKKQRSEIMRAVRAGHRK
jgi:hypothetical protein